jgi:hypothetical protein
MASLAMASSSSVAVFAPAPVMTQQPTAVFSSVSCVRMVHPQRYGVRRRTSLAVVAMAQPQGSGVETQDDIDAKVKRRSSETPI